MVPMGASKYLTGFKDSDHEILVKIVKGAQWRQMKGKKGEWKDFVEAVNRKRGGCLSDPAKHPVDVLSSFVQTLTKKEDIELVKRIRKWGEHRAREKLLNEREPYPKTPYQELVELTQMHPRYRAFYSFQSWNEGWALSKGDVDSPVRLVSLDCEMVVCEGDIKEVVRVCAVGSDCKTLLDELVVPSRKVKDYLTSITGVSEKDLEGITFTQADAQAQVLKLLAPSTILVGHSLYHDLRALKIDHKRVIDTSFLYRDATWPVAYSPSLSNLCKIVLNYKFREEDKPHNCLDDAIIPMRLVQHWLEHSVSNLSLGLPQKEVNQETASKLFLHMVPNFVTVPQLHFLFQNSAACEIKDIVLRNRAKTGSTFANFSSREEADSAFQRLEGLLAKDSYGYPQKTVSLMSKEGQYTRRVELQVRKMVNDRTVVEPDMVSDSDQEIPLLEISRKRLPDDCPNDKAEREVPSQSLKSKKMKPDVMSESKNLTITENSDSSLCEEASDGCLIHSAEVLDRTRSNVVEANKKDQSVASGGESRIRGETNMLMCSLSRTENN